MNHRQVVMPIRSRLCVSTSEAAIQAAIAGAGLARVMSYKMEAAKREGALEIVLDRSSKSLCRRTSFMRPGRKCRSSCARFLTG